MHPIGEEYAIPTRTSSLRYPETEEQDYAANLSSDGQELTHSPFEPKFTPAIVAFSS